jgi:hypothetical protein
LFGILDGRAAIELVGVEDTELVNPVDETIEEPVTNVEG